MSGVLDKVNQRTQLVGKNRLELLLFRLNGKQIYGINVFKVKEVLQCPKLFMLPHRDPIVVGVAHIRGGTVTIMDLSMAIGRRPLDDIENCFVIMTEYNGKTQGFLVGGVERIVNTNWEDIHPPPKGAGGKNFLTAVTEFENQLVEIIDVELVLDRIAPAKSEVSEGIITEEVTSKASAKHVLIVDDSSIARKQLKRVTDKIGIESTLLNDGRQALEHLQELAASGKDPAEEYCLVISDIEMPEMDGYTFVAEVRHDPRLAHLHIILHTSLSGVFNKAMVAKVGANDFLAKFDPDAIANKINERINA